MVPSKRQAMDTSRDLIDKKLSPQREQGGGPLSEPLLALPAPVCECLSHKKAASRSGNPIAIGRKSIKHAQPKPAKKTPHFETAGLCVANQKTSVVPSNIGTNGVSLPPRGMSMSA